MLTGPGFVIALVFLRVVMTIDAVAIVVPRAALAIVGHGYLYDIPRQHGA